MDNLKLESIFDNDFMEGEVRLKGKEISRKMMGEFALVIRADGCEVATEQEEKLFGSLRKAFDWEKEVLNGQAKDRFWEKGEIVLTLRDKMEGLMQNNFDIKAKYALGKSEETVAAAIFHELLEMWRDEFGLVGEGAPLMAEFLLCGDDRFLFRELCDDYGKEMDSHQIGWNKVVKNFGFEGDENKNLFEEMYNWKLGMNEEEKLAFIKNNLVEWKQP